MRVIMRGHEKKLGFVMSTPKGAVEEAKKDVYNMFNSLQELCRKLQGDIRTLQVQQPGTPVVMPLSMAFLVANDFSSLLDTPAENDSTVIIHAHQIGIPNRHTHEVSSRQNPHATGQHKIEPGRPFTRNTIGAADGGCRSGQTTTSSSKVLQA